MAEVYDYIDFHNQTRSTFDKLRRIDTRDYPEVAVREALLNSLVHREYSFRASTLISIYNDRIEFTSIGGLVSGVTLNDVLMGISVCRNTKLANVFYRLELIEAYGTGMRKIMNAYEGSGKTPQIETSDNAFKIILPNLNAQTEKKQLSDESDSQAEKVMQLARKQGRVTRKEVEKLLSIGQTTSGRLLKKMMKNGQLIQEGKGKTTCYRLFQ
ncbi:putative HTH transcriptional regulator [Sporomusaceae bacterium BoRhaA]|uniref:DUF977 family protein n=1 Tax=Pelorhabdus rhamnosifermentans TaxID=2772457 RepID=UPI001C05EE7C|nr:DUF977 family protein [Pelorhabdus rhamnosifermentans]MBU2701309.1 putative HTH transcriptional regulator [Pelorhabdus rhamnosifermentans]